MSQPVTLAKSLRIASVLLFLCFPAMAADPALQAILSHKRLDSLQWPNFSDYSQWVDELYAKDGGQLLWTSGGKPTPQALQMIAILQDADKKGLDAKDYDAARWQNRLQSLGPQASPQALADFDVALTVSSMRYISDLHLGKLDPKILHKGFDPERTKYDLAEFLQNEVARSGDVAAALKVVEPPFSGYGRTLEAYQRYLELAQQETPSHLATVKKAIDPGKEYEQLPQLVARLKFLGDLSADYALPAGSLIYEGAVVDAVKAFQARHGLDTDGRIGAQTIAELNISMKQRLKQLKLTLERYRWVPHDFGSPPIVVNIPEFKLRALDDSNHVTFTSPVIVGRAMRTETPVFQGDLKYVVFWPYWNVPPSIARNEIAPKIAKDPDYLRKNDYEITDYSGKVLATGAVSEELLAQLKAGKVMVRQRPGPKNALGLIKFIFPNSNNVYLHSTPSPGLFKQNRRDFSHGCIRVEDPAGLAEYVLRNNSGWDKTRIDAAFKAQKEQQINLPSAIPVLIVYGTAVVPEDGRVHFYQDIYGHDAKMEKALANAYAAAK